MGGSKWPNGDIKSNASRSSRERIKTKTLNLRGLLRSMESKDGSWCRCCTPKRHRSATYYVDGDAQGRRTNHAVEAHASEPTANQRKSKLKYVLAGAGGTR